MRKTLLPLIILLILATAIDGYAQKKPRKNKKEKPAEEYPLSADMGGETVKYAILEDAPENVKHTYVALDYSGIEFGSTTFVFGGGVDAKFQSEKFMIGANFFREYFNILGNSATTSYDATPLERSPYLHTELVGTYFLNNIDKTSKTGVPITTYSTYEVSSNGSGYRTHTRGIKIPAKLNSRFGIRAGYAYHQNDDEFASMLSSKDYDHDIRVPSIRSHSLVLGVSLVRARNIRIKTENYGEKSRTGLTHFYGDILIAPSIKATAYESFNGGNYIPLVDDTTLKNNIFGARIGYETLGTWKKFYVRTAYELGMRPTLKGHLNAYVLIKGGMGMSF
jgi:hypothetical protein